MKPLSRLELYLNSIANNGNSGIPKKPFSRQEKYLDAICKKLKGEEALPPKHAFNRTEKYLKFIYENIGNSGSGFGQGGIGVEFPNFPLLEFVAFTYEIKNNYEGG